VSPLSTVIGLAVVAGAIIGLSARDGRTAAVGLLAALALAPLVVDQVPDIAPTAARIAGAVLAVYLLRIPLRSSWTTVGSRIGWPAEGLAAAAAFLAGAAAQDAAMPGFGPAAATATGFALLALAAAPLLERNDLLRRGLGLLLALTGADLIRTGLAGPGSGFESIVVAAAVAAVGAAVALLLPETPAAPRGGRIVDAEP
jgi:hypothetical protein